MNKDHYCIDSSSLIHAWRRAYPVRNFSALWDRLDDLIEERRIISSIEVFKELEKRDDEVFSWAKERRYMFIEIDDNVQIRVGGLMGSYPRLVDTRKNKSTADPFVIALALAHEKPCIVVSEEGATNSLEKPKIPDVCAAEGLECIKILNLIVREDWQLA